MHTDFYKLPIAERRIFGFGLIALDILERDGIVRRADRAGGTCANVLAILGYLGWSSYPIGRLNGDKAAQQVRRDLQAFSVNLDYASVGPSSKTPIVRHLIESSGEHRFSFRCPRCMSWLPTYQSVTANALLDLLTEIEVRPHVIFIDRGSPAALRLAEKGRESGSLIVFEPSGRSSSRLTTALIEAADVLKYSFDSAVNLDLPVHRSVAVEIATHGRSGLRFRVRSDNGRQGTWSQLVARDVSSVRDGAGSGDWCTAGFLHALVARRPIREVRHALADAVTIRSALEFGQAIAAWNCQYEGARGSMYAVSRKNLRESVEHALSSKITDESEWQDPMRTPLTPLASDHPFRPFCVRCGA